MHKNCFHSSEGLGKFRIRLRRPHCVYTSIEFPLEFNKSEETIRLLGEAAGLLVESITSTSPLFPSQLSACPSITDASGETAPERGSWVSPGTPGVVLLRLYFHMRKSPMASAAKVQPTAIPITLAAEPDVEPLAADSVVDTTSENMVRWLTSAVHVVSSQLTTVHPWLFHVSDAGSKWRQTWALAECFGAEAERGNVMMIGSRVSRTWISLPLSSRMLSICIPSDASTYSSLLPKSFALLSYGFTFEE